MEKLIVSNFGAIQHIEIELKNLTLFIGKSGTGKSTLAKLIAIFRSVDFWIDKDFNTYLAGYGIANYMQENTTITYSSVDFIFSYDKGKTKKTFSASLQDSISNKLGIKIISDKEIKNLVKQIVEASIKENLYIPAERNLIPQLREGQFEKNLAVTTISAGLAEFGEAYMRAAKSLQTYKTNIFDVTFQRKGTEDYVVLPNERTLKLSEVASGMQTTIPALLVLEHLAKNGKPRSFTFEEPELNLFPTAQKALVEFLAEKVLNNGHQLVICTHSPYILTSLNNLLFAYQVKKQFPESKEKVLEIINEDCIVSSDELAIYYLPSQEEFEDYETFAVDLLDKDTGLIPDNELDSASEYIVEDFKSLMSIYREYKRPNRNNI